MIYRQFRFLSFYILILIFSFCCRTSEIKAEELKTQITKSENYHKNLSNDANAGQNLTQIWNSPEGLRRLANSDHNNDFYQMVNFYQPQINPLYCGIASSVIILNSLKASQDKIQSQKDLEVKKPESLGGGVMSFRSYSQLTFLNQKTDLIKNRKIIELKNLDEIKTDKNKADPGLSLDDLAKVLKQVYQLKVKVVHADSTKGNDIEKFRNLLEEVLSDKTSYLMVNFDAKDLGFKSRGHFSPIAAYDEISDLVLIMDVATHDRPWYWVSVNNLYQAMHTKDGNKYRGYMIISE